MHEMLVDLCRTDIDECMDAEAVMLFYSVRLGYFFKLLQCFFKLPVIAQIEMCIQQIVQPLYIMTRFHSYHQGLLSKQVHPFFCVPVVLNKILADECIPGVALV